MVANKLLLFDSEIVFNLIGPCCSTEANTSKGNILITNKHTFRCTDLSIKLEGVGPLITDPPQISFINFFFFLNVICDM